MKKINLLFGVLILMLRPPMENSANAASCNLILSIASVDATCGNNDGSATPTITGGTAPYVYQWTSGDTTANADFLKAGIYILTVTDSNGCSETGVAAISNSDGPSVTVSAVTDVSCSGNKDGSVSLSTNGGMVPYTYNWSTGDTIEDLNNLRAGPYELHVEDAAGCIASVSISIGTPAPVDIVVTSTVAACGNTDGSASAVVIGGTLPYTYNWSTGATSSSLNGLGKGIYNLTITDANGCTNLASAAVSESGSAVITIDTIENVSCGVSLGSILISTTGGASPLTYSWSDGSVDEDLIGVPAGEYSITITGADSCAAAEVVSIGFKKLGKPEICLVTVDSITGKNVCVFEKDSTFNAGVDYYNFYKGTSKSSVYHWIGNKSSSLLSAWADAGSNTSQKSWKYKVAAVDTCGIESWWSDLHKSMHLIIKRGVDNDFNLIWDHYEGFTYPEYIIHRYHASTGWVVLDTISSTVFTYADLDAPQGQLTYNIEAIHPFGCLATKQKNFNSAKSNTSTALAPGPMTIAISSTDATSGNCDGTASVTPSGGTSPFTYLWNDSTAQTNATATGLCPGTYIVIVVDANGNSVQDQVLVSQGTGTGINQLSMFYGVKASPNPFNQTTSLEFNNMGQDILYLTIYDITGRLVREYRNITTNRVIVQRNDLKAGTYYYHLKGEKGIDIGKLVIN